MNKTAREIRRAFENITPNVLDRVLSQSSLKKGAVTPMKEKKPFIPYAIQKIASAAAVVVLLVAIGIVALMILNGRTNPQLSDNPTELPTEAPTEPVVIPEGPASQEKAIAYMKLHVKNPDRYELIDYTYQERTDKYEAMFLSGSTDTDTPARWVDLPVRFGMRRGCAQSAGTATAMHRRPYLRNWQPSLSSNFSTSIKPK